MPPLSRGSAQVGVDVRLGVAFSLGGQPSDPFEVRQVELLAPNGSTVIETIDAEDIEHVAASGEYYAVFAGAGLTAVGRHFDRWYYTRTEAEAEITTTQDFYAAAAGTPAGDEPTLSLTFEDIYLAVAQKLYGIKAGLSDAQAVEAKDLANQGYLLVLTAHDWVFLDPAATLTVTAGASQTDLPADFGHLEAEFAYAPGNLHATLMKVTPAEIRELRSRAQATADAPWFFALEPVPATAGTGQRWRAQWYPTFLASVVLHYRYHRHVNKLVNDTDVPVGGQYFGETVKAAALLKAEEVQGQVNGAFYRAFYGDGKVDRGALGRAIDADKEGRGANLGPLLNQDGRRSPWPMDRGTVTFGG